MIYIAFYKGNSRADGIQGIKERLEDGLIRLFTRGIYSHCEIAICLGQGQRYNAIGFEIPPEAADPILYECYTSSPRDGGVRRKTMPLPFDQWDLIPLVNMSDSELIKFFHKTEGKKYDWLGALGFALPLFKHERDKYFCSEWCAAALGLFQPHTFSPNGLYDYLMNQEV